MRIRTGLSRNGEERAHACLDDRRLFIATGISEIGLGGEEFLRLRDAAQSVAADRHQAAAHFGAKGIGKARRKQHILLDRPAHRQDPADFVDRWADDREIEAILAADIAVKDVADVKREINRGRRQTGCGFGFRLSLTASFARLAPQQRARRGRLARGSRQ